MFTINSYELARVSILISLISSTKGSFPCPRDFASNATMVSSFIAVHVRKTFMCPPDLQVTCGCMVLSPGNSRSLCLVLRSEWWQQVRFFKNCLRIACLKKLCKLEPLAYMRNGQGLLPRSLSSFGTKCVSRRHLRISPVPNKVTF